MLSPDNFFFWPAVVLIGIVIIALSFRILLRVILFFVAVLVIWYVLFQFGFVRSPQEVYNSQSERLKKEFFNDVVKNSEQATESLQSSLHDEEARRLVSVE